MRIRHMIFAGAAVAAATLGAQSAQALKFNLIDTGGAAKGTQARLGFDIAAAYWSSVLTNDTVVNLNIGFRALATGVLGSTGSTRADVRLNSVVDAMAATGDSALDGVALGTLSQKVSNGSISAITNGPAVAAGNLGVNTGTLQFDNDGSQNNSYIYGNTSVLKAMGLTRDEFTGASFANVSDGSVTFSTGFAFDFDPTDGLTAGAFDFIGVAVHEIGHALGFVSGVDLYDAYGFPNGPNAPQGGFDFDNPGGGLMSTLDLFRYSNDVRNVVPGTGAVLDWSVARPSTIALGGNPFFSIDGRTEYDNNSFFSTGRFNGDGQQASHWKDLGGCVGQIGIMDPNFCRQQEGDVTGTDLAAFDAMGWNINFDVLSNPRYTFTTSDMYNSFRAAVPEAATWMQMVLGFGVLGGALRAGGRRKAVRAA